MQDYEDFDLANEDDELEEFLGIPRKTPKANPDAAAKQNGHAETNGYEGEGKGHFKEANLISNYRADGVDGPQEMEINLAGARHSWARQHAWL